MSCFIIKTGITGVIYSINTNDRKTVIAFKTKQQAGTYKRLINEMNNCTHNNKFKIEQTNISFMIRNCTMSAVDFTLLDEKNESQVWEAEKNVSDDMRFHLENKYKYGS